MVAIGDDARDRQIVAILSFDTSNLPNDAVIYNAILKMCGATLSNPDLFSQFRGTSLNIKKGAYSKNPALQPADFRATGLEMRGVSLAPIDSEPGCYQATIKTPHVGQINKTGLTQFRIRFRKDDNDNNLADQISFSGLIEFIIEYTAP